MRISLPVAIVAVLFAACGGAETPTPAPEPAPAPVPAPAPEPVPAPPAPVEEPVDLSTLSPADQKAKLMEIGEKVYKTGGTSGIACITCHMDAGQGVPPAFPPLAGSKDMMGDCKQHAGYVVKGLTGEITVAGTKYNGVMPAQPNLSDLEIASVITFERNSFGNDYGICLPADVAAVR